MNKFVVVFIALFLPLVVSAEAVVEYPYNASPERAELINSQFTNIKVGDSIDQVLLSLPNPDEVRDLYGAQKLRPKVIGKPYWYLIQRKVESGSVNERDKKLVRVSFNLQGIVTKIDHWGF